MAELIARTRIEVEGQREITAQLRGLDRKVRKKVLRKATSAAAKELHKEARRLAPRQNGLLRMSLKVQIKSGKTAVWGKIGQEKNRQFKRKRLRGSNINRRGYAAPIWWIESGTKAHRIEAPTGKRGLAWSTGKRKGSKGTLIVRRSVKHPGMRGQQVLERAGRHGAPAAGSIWRAIVTEELAKTPSPAGEP